MREGLPSYHFFPISVPVASHRRHRWGCLGLAIDIASAFDVRLAASNAVFAIAVSSRGYSPPHGGPSLTLTPHLTLYGH